MNIRQGKGAEKTGPCPCQLTSRIRMSSNMIIAFHDKAEVFNVFTWSLGREFRSSEKNFNSYHFTRDNDLSRDFTTEYPVLKVRK